MASCGGWLGNQKSCSETASGAGATPLPTRGNIDMYGVALNGIEQGSIEQGWWVP